MNTVVNLENEEVCRDCKSYNSFHVTITLKVSEGAERLGTPGLVDDTVKYNLLYFLTEAKWRGFLVCFDNLSCLAIIRRSNLHTITYIINSNFKRWTLLTVYVQLGL